jgi:hypothetical protein
MNKVVVASLVLAWVSATVANEGTVIRLSEVIDVGNVVVKPGTEYIVDLSGYEVPQEARLIIFHVLGTPRSHYYYQEIESGKSLYEMNATTLMATTGSPPFKGLSESDGAFLIIGSEVEPGSINMGILYSNESLAVIVRD